MTSKKCIQCGKAVGKQEKICPECGTSVEPKKSLGFIPFLLIVLIAISLLNYFGTGQKKSAEKADKEPSQQIESTETDAESVYSFVKASVQERLNVSGDIDFPGKGNAQIEKVDDGHYIVTAYVDLKSDAGKNSRKRFVGEVEKVRANHLKLTSLQISDQ